MRLFNQTELSKGLNEVEWQYRLHVKDIFKNFQAEKINLKQAKSLIVSRVTKFLDQNETLPEDAKKALIDFKDTLKGESDIDALDQLIGIKFFDIADEFKILVK
jgi:hypothetical protein